VRDNAANPGPFASRQEISADSNLQPDRYERRNKDRWR
jgi:hypothetical protein